MNVFIVTPGTRSSHILVSLRKSLRDRGVVEIPIIPSHCQMWVHGNTVRLRYKGEWLPKPDVVVNGLVQYPGIEIVEGFEDAGIPVVNKASATRRADVKALTSIALGQAGIAHPPTVFSYSSECWSGDTPEQLQSEMKQPLFLKPSEGSWGRGVHKLDSWIETLAHLREKRPKRFLVQEMIRYSGLWYRIIVIGGKAIVAKCNRSSQRFLPDGATVPAIRSHTLTPERADFAERVAKAVGLDFVAVDICEGPKGFVVLELNAWSNCIDIDEVNNFSVGDHLAKYVIERGTTKK